MWAAAGPKSGYNVTERRKGDHADTLGQLLRDGDYDAHRHIASADFQTELTVMLDRAFG